MVEEVGRPALQAVRAPRRRRPRLARSVGHRASLDPLGSADVDIAPRAAQAYDDGMRGDRVEVVVDVGTGVQTFEIVATRAGRRVEVTTGRGVVEVSEVTRSGAPVRTARFMATRVVALVEHPAEDDAEGRPRHGRRQIEGQGSIV